MSLTADFIFKRCNVNSLESVKSLQCWGMKLSNVEILSDAANLEVLNLSCNNLATLQHLESCKSIRQLFLRKNNISSFEELQYLKNLPDLQTLWLTGNPISSLSNYRQSVLTYLPQLQKLDDTAVSDEEKESAVGLSTVQNPIKSDNQSSQIAAAAILTLVPLLDESGLLQVHDEICNRMKTSKEL